MDVSSGQGEIPDWRLKSASAAAPIRCDSGTNSIVWMKEDVSARAERTGGIAKPAKVRSVSIGHLKGIGFSGVYYLSGGINYESGCKNKKAYDCGYDMCHLLLDGGNWTHSHCHLSKLRAQGCNDYHRRLYLRPLDSYDYICHRLLDRDDQHQQHRHHRLYYEYSVQLLLRLPGCLAL